MRIRVPCGNSGGGSTINKNNSNRAQGAETDYRTTAKNRQSRQNMQR